QRWSARPRSGPVRPPDHRRRVAERCRADVHGRGCRRWARCRRAPRAQRWTGASVAVLRGVGAIEIGEEALELSADLIAGGQLATLGQQILTGALRGAEGVVLTFETFDERGDVGVLGDVFRNPGV